MDDYRDTIGDESEPLGSLEPGGSAGGSIETNDDADFFAITLVAGLTYTIHLDSGTLFDPVLYVYNASKALLFANDDSGGSLNAALAFHAPHSGTYYLAARAYSFAHHSGYTGTYTISISAGELIDDFRDALNDPMSPLGTAGIGHAAAGFIEQAGDADLFAITLYAGVSCHFDLAGAGKASALANGELSLLAADGTILASDDDSGEDLAAHIDYTAAATASAYLVARSSQTASADGTGAYSIVLGYDDDYRDTIGDESVALGSVGVGGEATGSISVPGDIDLFGVTLQAHSLYTIHLAGDGETPLINHYVRVRAADGTLLVGRWDSGLDTAVTLRAPSDGAYYIDAHSYYESTGDYVVGVELVGLWLAGSGRADTLDGSAGNDTLIGGGAGDTLAGEAGTDRLRGGRGADSLSGGVGGDQLSGGSGADRLEGGAGHDVFAFYAAPGAVAKVDILVDFVAGEDTILLGHNAFAALPGGVAVTEDQLRAGNGVTDAADDTDFLLYDAATGKLYYDADASGSVFQPVLFAVLGTTDHPTIRAADFQIVG